MPDVFTRCSSKNHSECHSPNDTDAPPHERERHSLDEELEKDVMAAGTHSLAQPDLPRPLRNGDEHDIHDADTADEQRNPGYERNEHREAECDLTDNLCRLFRRAGTEVIFIHIVLRIQDAMSLAKQRCDIRNGKLIILDRLHGHVTQLLVARGGTRRGEWDVYGRIKILHESRANTLESSYDRVEPAANPDALADGVLLPEEIFRCLMCEDSHGTRCLLIRF